MKMKFLSKSKFESVHPWRHLLKRWSIWFNAIGAFLLSIDPATVTQVWMMLPPDIKSTLPQWLPKAMGVGLMIVGVISLNVRQKGLRHG